MRFFHFILLLLFSTSLLAQTKRAVLIGPTYQDNPLPGVKRDLQMMEEVCQKLGFAKEEILIISGSVTRENVIAALDSRFLGNFQETLIYFSGSMIQLADENNNETDGLDEALVLDYSDGEHEVLRDDEFQFLLQSLTNEQNLVLLDTSFSSGFFSSTQSLWLGATNDNQMASGNAQGGAFTRALHAFIQKTDAHNLQLKQLAERLTKEMKAVSPGQRVSFLPLFDIFKF